MLINNLHWTWVKVYRALICHTYNRTVHWERLGHLEGSKCLQKLTASLVAKEHYHYTNHWYLRVSVVAIIFIYACIIWFEGFVYCSVKANDYQWGGSSFRCVISLCWNVTRESGLLWEVRTEKHLDLESWGKKIKLWYLKSCGFLFLNLVGVKVG